MSSLRSKIIFHISGMTCENCQKKIAAALRQTVGIHSAEVSFVNGTAVVLYDADRIARAEIRRVIETLGYRAEEEKDAAAAARSTANLLIIILGLYLLLQRFGLLNFLVPSRLAAADMSYAALFLVGLLTSVHCIAMCGGINLSQCMPRGPRPAEAKAATLPRPALAYNLGRVVSYTAIGAVLGFCGMVIGGGAAVLSPAFQGFLKLFAGALMVVMGINLLGLLPWLRRFNPRLPRFLAERIDGEKAAGRGPFVVGLLNGFLPCGPLQAMQIVALASGSPAAGALSMLAFSLGTVPLMLGLGSLVCALGQRFARQVLQIGAVLVAVLGLAMVSQGVSLAGLARPSTLSLLFALLALLAYLSVLPVRRKALKAAAITGVAVFAVGIAGLRMARTASPRSLSGVPALRAGGTAAESSTQMENGVQVVRSTLSGRQYPSITVQQGVPVRWIIDAPAGSVNGCNYRMMLSPFGQEVELHEGENIVEFTPEQSGSYDYSCWMGMVYGNVTVAGADGAVPQGTAQAAPAPASGGCAMCAGLPVLAK